MPVVLWGHDPVIEPRVEHLLELPEDVFRRMHVHLQGGSGGGGLAKNRVSHNICTLAWKSNHKMKTLSLLSLAS